MFSCRPHQMESKKPKYPGGGERNADKIVSSMVQYTKGEKHLIHLKSKEGKALAFLFKINGAEYRHPYTVFYNSNFGEVEFVLEDDKALHRFITENIITNGANLK